MHDPQTVAFDIRSPFKRNGYRPTILTIWHVDPERGGSDDSCGWSYVRMTKEQREEVRKLGAGEQPFITGKHGFAMEPFELLLEVWQTIGARMFKRKIRGRRGAITHRELMYVLNLASNPGDNLRHSCAGAGTPEGMANLFATVLRCYLTFHRPWWRAPRWHVHHWRLQFHPAQAFKRWAFSRCGTCGGRFSWGYCPTTHSWHGTGPQWFKGERDVHHSECLGHRTASNSEAA